MDTRELIKKAQNGDKDSMALLIKENSALIWSIVRKFSSRGYDSEDLFQTGAVGLIKCIERFDLNYDVKFSTYAVPMIMGEIKRFLRDDGMIKVSRSIKETAAKVRAAEAFLMEKNGRKAEISEIAKMLNVGEDEVRIAVEASKEVESIYKSVNGTDGEIYILDKLKSDNKYTPDDELLLLRETVKKLDEKERRIIQLRYFNDRTQNETAEEMGMSQVQVSRLEKKILGKIKENIV